MSSMAKVAITIPVDTLRALERKRRSMRSSRSAAVTEAVQLWLHQESTDASDRRYAEAYLRHPERLAEIEATAAAVTAGWDPWE